MLAVSSTILTETFDRAFSEVQSEKFPGGLDFLSVELRKRKRKKISVAPEFVVMTKIDSGSGTYCIRELISGHNY